MAQLKDLIVNGATQLIGDAVTSNLKVTTVVAPAAANSATYGAGTNGQVLHSTSSSVYWGDTVDAVTIVPSFTTGQKIADITIDGATTSIYAPEGTVQVNADWNASTGVASILNKPTIPAAQVNANWTATTGVASILNKPSIPSTYSDVGAASAGHTHAASSITGLAAVATTGSYNSLSDKPTIPAAQVNANWTATTGVASILNKPSIPSTYTDVGAASAAHTHTYSDVGASSAGHTHTYSQVGAASAAHTHTYSDVGASSAAHAHGNLTSGGDITSNATIANGDRLVINDESASKIINSSITFGTSTTSFLANNGTWQTPAGTAQVNADWTATTGVSSILNKPTIPAAQVNANWTATTGVASILNKPSIPSTYTDVGAASSNHTHTYSAVGAASAAHTHTYSDVGAASAAHTHTYSDVGAASAGHTHTYSAVGAASAAHAHGSITSDGKITATGVAIANGDGLVFIDSSDSSKIKKSSITFGTSSTSFLANDGTWRDNNIPYIAYEQSSEVYDAAAISNAVDAGRVVYAYAQDSTNSYYLPLIAVSSYSFQFGGIYRYDYDDWPYEANLYISKSDGSCDGPYISALGGNDHYHGYVTPSGALWNSDITITSGDQLVVTDASDSGTIKKSPITFSAYDGKFLARNGSWNVPPGNYQLEYGQDMQGYEEDVLNALENNLNVIVIFEPYQDDMVRARLAEYDLYSGHLNKMYFTAQVDNVQYSITWDTNNINTNYGWSYETFVVSPTAFVAQTTNPYLGFLDDAVDAVNSGRYVRLENLNSQDSYEVYPVTYYDESQGAELVQFGGVRVINGFRWDVYEYSRQGDSWTHYSCNAVAAINSASTHNQLPTAKSVYDLVIGAMRSSY